MSSRVGLGIPVPSILPITGTFAAPFAAYFVLLSARIFQTRVQTHQYIGDSLSEDKLAALKQTSEVARQNSDPLTLNSRAFNNFLENVPLAFIFAGVAELNGANKKVLTYLLSALFVVRVGHVEYGIYGPDNAAWGRPIGYFGSLGVISALAGYSAWLVRSYWRV